MNEARCEICKNIMPARVFRNVLTVVLIEPSDGNREAVWFVELAVCPICLNRLDCDRDATTVAEYPTPGRIDPPKGYKAAELCVFCKKPLSDNECVPVPVVHHGSWSIDNACRPCRWNAIRLESDYHGATAFDNRAVVADRLLGNIRFKPDIAGRVGV